MPLVPYITFIASTLTTNRLCTNLVSTLLKMRHSSIYLYKLSFSSRSCCYY
nr:MAG TPA: hypothetical protein [Crassvirales sp.]